MLRALSTKVHRLRHDILGVLYDRAIEADSSQVEAISLSLETIAGKLKTKTTVVELQLNVLLKRKNIGRTDVEQDVHFFIAPDGSSSYAERTYLVEGRDERFKTMSVLFATIGVIGTIATIVFAALQYKSAGRLEERLERLEREEGPLQINAAPHSRMPINPSDVNPLDTVRVGNH